MIDKFKVDGFPRFIIISSVLHLVILLFTFIGIGSFNTKEVSEDIIVVEILPVGAVNNVKNKRVQKQSTIKNDNAKKVEKSKKSEQKKEKTKEKEKTKSTDSEKTPENIKKDNKPKEPSPEKSEKKEQVSKKASEDNKKKNKDKELDSILKNLEDESDGENKKSHKISRQKTKDTSDAFSSLDADDGPETITNDELIKQQIKKHWNQPVASATENISIAIELFIEDDGTIMDQKIVSIDCPDGKDITCMATRDSIIRAIRNASPLVNLNSSDYISWSQLIITFNTLK
jgi:membrane protein involved in colicin uptake